MNSGRSLTVAVRSSRSLTVAVRSAPAHPIRTAPVRKRPQAHAKTAIQRQIDATDRQACPDAGRIDQLVYELYGLTDDEIRIVEQATDQP